MGALPRLSRDRGRRPPDGARQEQSRPAAGDGASRTGSDHDLTARGKRMREERGTIAGDLVVDESLTLWGSVGGDVYVVEKGRLYLRGAVYGDLTIEYGG